MGTPHAGSSGKAAWGVPYRTDTFSAKEVTVIVLNDLRDEPHNAYVKLFASRKSVKRKAIAQLKEIGVFAALTELSEFLYGLARLLFKADDMDLREEERRFPKELIESCKQSHSFRLLILGYQRPIYNKISSHTQPKRCLH